MGAHWQWLGYGSVDSLVAEARSGGSGQLALMVRYINKAGLAEVLRRNDWAAFAHAYNGPAYKKFDYDLKLQKAYRRLVRDAAAPVLPELALENARGLDDAQLAFGCRGPAVKKVQHALTRLGYVLVVDGLFGLVTDRIVRQFQRDHGIIENGIVGVSEWKLIFSDRLGLIPKIKEIFTKRSPGKLKTVQALAKKISTGKSRVKRAISKHLLSISKRIA
jgi:hypothetical protein